MAATLLLLLTGCAPPTGDPEWIAWRAGAGHWPADSLWAAEEAIAAELDGVHLDVSLTVDSQAILLPEWPSEIGCTGPLDQPTWAHTLETLQAELTCGSEADPDHPNALRQGAPPASLADLLPYLRTASGRTQLVLDLHTSREHPPEQWGPALLDELLAADVPPPLVVVSDSPSTLAAVRNHATSRGRDLTTWLHVPLGLELGLPRQLGELEDPGDWDALARVAGVDGLVVRWDDAWPRRLAGTETSIVIRSPERADVHEVVADWPAAAVLTAYPGRR